MGPNTSIRTAIERCTAAIRTAIRTGASPEECIRTGNSDFFRPIRRSLKKNSRADSALYTIAHYVSPVRIVFLLPPPPFAYGQPVRYRLVPSQAIWGSTCYGLGYTYQQLDDTDAESTGGAATSAATYCDQHHGCIGSDSARCAGFRPAFGGHDCGECRARWHDGATQFDAYGSGTERISAAFTANGNDIVSTQSSKRLLT